MRFNIKEKNRPLKKKYSEDSIPDCPAPKRRKIKLIKRSSNTDVHFTIEIDAITCIQEHGESYLREYRNHLTCSICSELFIKPVVLNCDHSFCEHCFKSWCKTVPTCPICLKDIEYYTKSLVKCNDISKITSSMTKDELRRRDVIVRKRERKYYNEIRLFRIARRRQKLF